MSVAFDILRVLCTLFGLIFYLSPSPRMRQVVKSKTTGELPLIPFLFMFSNYHCRMMHGLFLDDVYALGTTMFMGEVIFFAYTMVYLKYTPDLKHALKLCAVGFGVTGLITIYALLAENGVIHQTHEHAGFTIGYCIIVITFTSFYFPVTTILNVVRTQSSAMLIPRVLMATTCNNLIWSIYAFSVNDIYLIIPNVTSFALDLVLICVYIRFLPSKLNHRSVVTDLENLAISIVISPRNTQETDSYVLESPTYEMVRSPLGSLHVQERREEPADVMILE